MCLYIQIMNFSGNFMIFNKVDKGNFGDDRNLLFHQIPAMSSTRNHGIGREGALEVGVARKNGVAFFWSLWRPDEVILGLMGLFGWSSSRVELHGRGEVGVDRTKGNRWWWMSTWWRQSLVAPGGVWWLDEGFCWR